MRYMGIDYGSHKVGVALSDEAGVMGFPHSAVPNNKHLVPHLAELIQEQHVGVVVIGESEHARKEQHSTDSAHSLGDALTALGIDVVYELEAYTTQEARRDLEGNRTRTEGIDASAAALILTSYLSRHGGPH